MKRFLFFLLGALWAVIPMTNTQAQTMLCAGSVNVSVDSTFQVANGADSCHANLSATMFSTSTTATHISIRESMATNARWLNNKGVWVKDEVRYALTANYAFLKPHIGKTYVYSLHSAATGGNSCWGQITFEDKSAPDLNTLLNDTVFCWRLSDFLGQRALYNAQTKRLSLTGNGAYAFPGTDRLSLQVNVPLVRENCGIEAVTVTDILVTASECQPVYRRTWKVTDCGGNIDTISHLVTILQPTWSSPSIDNPLEIGRLIFPVDDTLVCGHNGLPICPTRRDLGSGPVPVQTGGFYAASNDGPHLPAIRFNNIMTQDTLTDSLDVCITTLDSKLCNFFTSYTDVTVEACALNCHGNRKIFRRWSILDWCNGNIHEGTQVIKIIDNVAPTAIAKDTSVSTRPWDCSADAWVPDIWELYDNCDLDPTYTLTSADPWVRISKVGNRWRASGLKLGSNNLQWVLKDCCGNERILAQSITVFDRTAPVPVAKQDIVISVTPGYDENGTPDAQAKLFVASVDNGSFDNCTNIRREIRRPAGGDCGNATFTSRTPRHNSNRTFRSNIATTNSLFYAGRSSNTASQNFANVPAFGQNALWTWTRPNNTDVTVAGGIDHTGAWALFSINEKENNWIWIRKSTFSGLDTFTTAVIPQSPASSAWTLSDANFRANSTTSLYNALDEDGGEFVKFCCEDITTAGADWNRDGTSDVGYHEVIMRVWDDGNGDGCIGCWVLPSEGQGQNPVQDNYNDTWAFVKVENKVPPVLTCPNPVTVSCEAPITTSTTWAPATESALTFTGMPTAWSACGTPVLEYQDIVSLDQCRKGFIYRTFRIVGTTHTCTQTITVSTLGTNNAQTWTFNGRNRDNPTSTSTIPWPTVSGSMIRQCGVSEGPTNNALDSVYYATGGALVTTNCEGPTRAEMEAKAPYYVQGACDVIGVNIDSDRFDFEEGQCRKWVVTYTYMNWCDNKCVTFKRDWVFRDTQAPVIDCTPRPVYSQELGCSRNIQLTKSATDAGGCPVNTTAASTWLKWEVFVDVNANGSWDYAYSTFRTPITSGGTTWVPVSYGNGGNPVLGPTGTIDTKYLPATAPGANATIDFRFPVTGKESFHKVLWRVYDGCHNSTQCIEEIVVRDIKAPTPYCIHLSTALMQVPANGAGGVPMVEVWAKDFDRGSVDNCTDQKDLKFTFDNWAPLTANEGSTHYFDATGARSEVGNAAADARYLNGEIQKWLPASKSSAKVFTKKDLPGVTLKMSVIDWNGYVDFCSVELTLVCNDPINCAQAGSRIAGTVSTESNQTVNNVTVTIDANMAEYPVSVTTPTSGAYTKSVPNGVDYEVTASKAGDFLNGVSTLDLVMIQRHILGIQALATPYKLIAADVNNDGKVSASDLTELRKLILGIYNELPNNASWRFPVSSQTMNSNNPFPYLEKIMISGIAKDMMDQNFVAVKVGDVNGNVSVNVSNPAVESRSNNTVAMAVAEQNIAAGDVVEIPVTAANFNDVAGFQYTMNLKGASFVGINGGAIEISDNNIGVIAKDVITMSYANDKAVTVANDEVLFTIIVKAERAVKVSEMLSIGSAVTPAEAYNSDLKVGKVSLDVRTAPVTAIELMQNEPNPFKGQTTVNFMMPEAAAATLSVYDVTGKVVSVRNISANKGLNSEVFTREQLGASGVMYYTLKSGDFTATKKMIIIE